MRQPTTKALKRYAAKLLFQFRVTATGKQDKRRLCERQIRVVSARSAKEALAEMKKKGKAAQLRYKNPQGAAVRFEFVGVMELLLLGVECYSDEVWWEMSRVLLPSERRDRYIPSDAQLLASTAE